MLHDAFVLILTNAWSAAKLVINCM